MMKEITSVHNAARTTAARIAKAEGAAGAWPFCVRKRQNGGRGGCAASGADVVCGEGKRGGIRADGGSGGKHGLRAVCRLSGGHAGSQHGENAAGIVCTAKIPEPPKTLTGKRIVALDGVQDPGNVGTILRTADAAGFDGAIFGSGCADLYGAKTLRATMGSVFRVPVMTTENLPETLEAMKREGYAVAATELGGEDFYAHCPRGRAILVIGSEGQGISGSVRAAATTIWLCHARRRGIAQRGGCGRHHDLRNGKRTTVRRIYHA